MSYFEPIIIFMLQTVEVLIFPHPFSYPETIKQERRMGMDIYPYFNSPEIAAHCRKIGKEFSPKEQQILIAMSHRPMEEHVKGYRSLLPETEGMIIPNEFFPKGMFDLHGYILNMLANEQRRTDRFLNGSATTSFYRAKAIEQNDRYSFKPGVA